MTLVHRCDVCANFRPYQQVSPFAIFSTPEPPTDTHQWIQMAHGNRSWEFCSWKCVAAAVEMSQAVEAQ